MSGTWRIFKAVASKKAGEVKGFFTDKKNSEPVDRNLPLGLHINGRVKLDSTPFVLYGQQLQLQKMAAELDIQAFGLLKVEAEHKIYRFYLQSSDGKDEAMLQVAAKKNGEILECRLFQSLDQVFPQDSEEWAFWLSSEDGSIGWSAFETRDGVLYDRVWDESDADHVAPIPFKERIYLDSHGESISDVEHESMLYGRWINEEQQVAEYILLSAEEDNEGALVHIMVGIDLNPMSVKVVY